MSNTSKKGVIYYLEKIYEVLSNPVGPTTQVQSDWNQTDETKVDYIKNKPRLPESFPKRISVDNIQEIPGVVLDSLAVGDVVVKRSGVQKHAYLVSYKGEGVGEGICLSYNACGYGETVAYDRTADGWVFNGVEVKT